MRTASDRAFDAAAGFSNTSGHQSVSSYAARGTAALETTEIALGMVPIEHYGNYEALVSKACRRWN